MLENRSRTFRNSLAILLAGSLSIVGIYLSAQFLEWEMERKINMDELLFLPSIVAFMLVGAAIGWLAYFDDMKKIMWNFIVIVLIFGLVFPIIVGVLVSRDQLENAALANIIMFPGSWFAAYVIHRSANHVAAEHGHKTDEFKEEKAEHDAAIERLQQRFYNE